ncbi:hypothetical protein Cni_G01426 [Canna indica]|uniref:PHD-type domain-containing protein n=1 Tax=Canna indica TaxID=4628 RepID=A0AAQ3JQI0_9LILI|nr:hypothetical protein Cni_G01426 [Canna indica]
MESNLEAGPSDNISFRKDDSGSFVSASVVKRRVHPKKKNANTKEASHSLSSSSSHDSSLENAESKETFRASGIDDLSDNVAVSSKVTLDALQDNNLLQEQTSSTGGTSDGSKTSDLHKKIASGIIDEKDNETCHMDNGSHSDEFKDSNNLIHDCARELDKKFVGPSPRSTESIIVKNDEKTVQNVVTNNSNEGEVEASQTESTDNGKLLLKNSTNSGFRDVRFCHSTNTTEDPDSSSNMSPKTQSPYPGSQRNSNLSQSSVDDDKSSIKEKLFVSGVAGEKDIAPGEVSKGDSEKSQPQLLSSRGPDECLGAENDNNSVFQANEEIKPSENNEQSDKPNSDSQMPQVPLQPNSECEDLAEIEDDVKVCDICGDAGKEELLAICSRCSDGAEHTYCMRIMLDKVPEGEWLCEECELKENAKQVRGKPDAQCEAIEVSPLGENCQNIESTSQNLPCVEKTDTRSDSKELVKSNSSKRIREDSEVTSVSIEKISETCGASSGTILPSKSPVLSHDNFSKPDTVKAKSTSLITSSGQLEGISEPGPRSQTSDIDTPKQARFGPTRGPLSKSVSFNNSKVPKVKQLLETIPKKQKYTRESNSSNTRNEGLFRTITKSASFRSESPGFSGNETICKTQSLNQPHPEDPQGMKQVKDRSIIDKKNSTSDRCSVSPAIPVTSLSSLKADSKVQQSDAVLKRTSDSSNLGDNGGPNDATTANEAKKQSSVSLLRNSGSTSLVRLCKNEDQKSFQQVPKAAELTHRDDKTKDHTFSSICKQAASAINRLPHCYKCNETGHLTQFCAVDTLRTTATKSSSDRSLRDNDSKAVKWKNAAEWLSWKYGTKKTSKLTDQPEEVSLSNAVVNSELTSKGSASSSLGSRNVPSVESSADVQDTSKVTNAIHVKKKVEEWKKLTFLPKKETCPDFSDDLDMKSIIQKSPSIPMLPLRASVMPEIGYIWQGTFEVLSTAKPPAHFDGFQAHLSTYVSPKALEVAKQFPCKFQLEEVPRLSSWPSQFHDNSPKEDNIALFFFAKDIESYENCYRKLLENMLQNDLALIGNIDAVELLIFASNLLPENSQRWNNFYYLWGVFRGRKKNSLGNLAGPEKNPSVSNLNIEPTAQDLATPIVSGLCRPFCISDGNNEDLSMPGRLPEANASQLSTCSDLQDIPSLRNENGVFKREEPPLLEKTLHQAVVDDNVKRNRVSCSLPGAFSTMSNLASVSFPKLHIDIEQLPSEMENDITSLDKRSSDSGSRKGPENDVHVFSTRVSNCEDCTSAALLNYWQGNDVNVQEIKKKDVLLASEPVLDNQSSENVMRVNLSRESVSNWKRAKLSSVVTIKTSSGHLLPPTADTMLCTDESSCTSLSDEKEHKKVSLDNGGSADCRSRDETLSSRLFSKMESIPSGLINGGMDYEAVSEGSKNAERYFFPIDPGPTTSKKADNLVYVLSSDDEDSPESNTPDLELALGGKRRTRKQDILPLSSPNVGEKRKRDMLSTPAVDDGDDTPASLSLSLGFPASKKTQTAKSNSETEQLLPDKPCINTSLLLFGHYTDT